MAILFTKLNHFIHILAVVGIMVVAIIYLYMVFFVNVRGYLDNWIILVSIRKDQLVSILFFWKMNKLK